MIRIQCSLFVAAMLWTAVSQASMYSITTPVQDGITVTTNIDTSQHDVSYVFDLNSLPYNYEQIAFSPSPMPAFSVIPFQAGSVSSTLLTEWNFHQMFDNGGIFIGWQLELQYSTGTPPPRDNTVFIDYSSSYAMTGNFLGQPGDENVQVTMRRQPGGFPPGQEDAVTLWAYVPEYVLLADMNLDTVLDSNDASAFVLALNRPTDYFNQYGVDPNIVGDLDGNGKLDVDDLDDFEGLLAAPGGDQASTVPEPATWGLLLLGTMLATLRRVGKLSRKQSAGF